VNREEAAAYIAGLTDEQLAELDRLLGLAEDDERQETRAMLRRAGLL
jgi:hypothetical protein